MTPGVPGALNTLRRALEQVCGEDQVRRAPELQHELARDLGMIPKDEKRAGCPYWGDGGAFADFNASERRTIRAGAILAADANRTEADQAQRELGLALAKRHQPMPRLNAAQVAAWCHMEGLTVDQVRAKERAAIDSDEKFHAVYRKRVKRQVPRDLRWGSVRAMADAADTIIEARGGVESFRRYVLDTLDARRKTG